MVGYLTLGFVAVISEDLVTVRAMWIGMEVTGWFAIVPLSVASLLTGLFMALGTKWGLFRHYWVAISFALTLLATGVLLLHMPDVSVMADLAQDADRVALESLGGDLLHPGIGLVVLLVIQVLNIYKPPGLTKYGWRKQQQARSR